MTKKNAYLFITTTICAIAIGVIGVHSSNHSISPILTIGTESPNLLLDSSQTPGTLTSDYQNNVNGSVTTTNGNTVELGFVNAKTAAGAFVQLAPRGKIFNFQDGAEEGRQIKGISAIKVTTSSGSVAIRTAPYRSSNGVVLGKSKTLVSGTKTSLDYAKYFELTALDGGATITSIELTCTCDSGSSVNNLNGVYTGVGNDSYTWKMTIDDGDVTIESLDKASNSSYSGTIAIVNDSRAECTFGGGVLYFRHF